MLQRIPLYNHYILINNENSIESMYSYQTNKQQDGITKISCNKRAKLQAVLDIRLTPVPIQEKETSQYLNRRRLTLRDLLVYNRGIPARW
jgi:hypothetical protein